MEPLGKRENNVSKEEQRSLLPSSNDVMRCSSLNFQEKEKKLKDIEPVLRSLISYIIDQEITKYINNLHDK
jgi:hypothetical protein